MHFIHIYFVYLDTCKLFPLRNYIRTKGVDQYNKIYSESINVIKPA